MLSKLILTLCSFSSPSSSLPHLISLLLLLNYSPIHPHPLLPLHRCLIPTYQCKPWCVATRKRYRFLGMYAFGSNFSTYPVMSTPCVVFDCEWGRLSKTGRPQAQRPGKGRDEVPRPYKRTTHVIQSTAIL